MIVGSDPGNLDGRKYSAVCYKCGMRSAIKEHSNVVAFIMAVNGLGWSFDPSGLVCSKCNGRWD